MFEYELQWIVKPEVCENAIELESTPLFLNLGNGRTQWKIKLIDNNRVIQFSLVSTADNGLPSMPFSNTSIKCIDQIRTIAQLENESYKTVNLSKDKSVHYFFAIIRTTLAELTSNYSEAFKVIVSFSLTTKSRLHLTKNTATQMKASEIETTTAPPSAAPTAKMPAPTKTTMTTKMYVFAGEKNNSEQILQDYAQLLNDHRHSDFTLIVMDHHFQCHKSILAGRCEVFADLIKYNGNEDTMTLLHAIDVETAADLLYYIYAGRVPNTAKAAQRLLVAADMFKLNLLKLRCEETLNLEVKMEKALKLLRLADSEDTSGLKEDSLDFIRNNLRSLMTNCSAFKDEMAKNPAFFYDLMLQIV